MILNNSKSIVLVGNGSAITECNAEKKIEAFDYVGRFNNFEIGPYEKYVGDRTDIWFTRICSTIKKRDISKIPLIYGVVNQCKWTNEIWAYLPEFRKSYPDIQIIDNLFVGRFAQSPPFNYDWRRNWLSVGMIALLFLLHKLDFKEVYLHGFAGDPNKHYFPMKPSGQEHHKFDTERLYIQKLHLDGKVKFLDLG